MPSRTVRRTSAADNAWTERKRICVKESRAEARPEGVRRLVDGRRLELPTSAARTRAGSGRIWLIGLDVNGIHANKFDARTRVFTLVSASTIWPQTSVACGQLLSARVRCYSLDQFVTCSPLNRAKSLTLTVTRTRTFACAMAAICPSVNGAGLPSLSRRARS